MVDGATGAAAGAETVTEDTTGLEFFADAGIFCRAHFYAFWFQKAKRFLGIAVWGVRREARDPPCDDANKPRRYSVQSS